MYNLVDLTDKKIVVTGASSGLGRATAILLSQLGACVIMIARREEELQHTLSKLEGGRSHCYFVSDLSQIDAIEPLTSSIVDKLGPIDGIAYCAGITDDLPLKFLKNDRFEKVMKINLEPFVELIRCFSIKKRYNKGMRIVGISSTAAFDGAKAHTAYAASKAGMDAVVRCLAYELADKGICINTVAPSVIETEMTVKYISDEESDGYKNLVGRQYLGIGKPIDVANGIAFLLSPAASFITGICLPIDGGFLSI